MNVEIKNNCQNCIWWEKEFYDKKYYTENHGQCKNEELDLNDGIFNAICMSEGISGDLITRSDFGCIMFKEI